MTIPLRFRLGALLVALGCNFIPVTANSAPVSPGDVIAADKQAMLTAVFPSIVRIEAIRMRPLDGRLMKQWSGGSGVIISATGQIVTNCHVTEDGDYFRCYLFDGSHLDARLVGQDALTDLAVLQLDLAMRDKAAPALVPARFGDSERLVAGEVVFALGSPGFLAQSVTQGVISNPSLVLPEQTAGKMILRGEDVGTLVRWVLHDARIFGGNSGGPLVNARGEVVGINEIGVFNLSGAIPGNLARAVSAQLIRTGRVVRGWSGLTVQPRLEADKAAAGVLVANVAPDSPAQLAGLQPGDLILSGDGHAIEGREEKAVAHFYRLETARLPREEFVLEYRRQNATRTVRLALGERTPAQADDVELRAWGVVARDVTRQLMLAENLPDTSGVWLENIRPSGPAGQAEPELRRQDVLIAVEGQPLRSVAELLALTDKLMAGVENGTRTVRASIRREGAVVDAVVELRVIAEHNVTPQVRKSWLGAATQVLTPKLATSLGIKSEGGARITRVYPVGPAAAAGLRAGDVILALDGIPVTARRAEDGDVLARQLRQYKPGTTAEVTLWRDGKPLELPLTLEAHPAPAAEMPWWEDVALEFSVHELAVDDRIRLQLPQEVQGLLVENAAPAGWASLAGLHGDDLIIQADGGSIRNVADLQEARARALQRQQTWWVLLVRNQGQTRFVEINLKPAKK